MKICALFVQQSLLEALEGESKFDFSMAEMNLKTLLEKTHNLIILSLGDKVLKQVLKEKTIVGLSMKLESLYMTKFFVNSLVLIQDEKAATKKQDEFNKLFFNLENIDV